ncbi:MAG: sulfatase-like hydrolase/transferase [Deltaproteobacteria bacterium]|nr:sulfatase-like hydrolase/transferase [Deltaproteobacteria bacterium]
MISIASYSPSSASVGKYSGPDVKNPVAAFAAMVEHLDNGAGEIMALLKELNIDESTVVMFSSDNGPHKEGGHKPDFFDSNGPLRGHKRDLYEGGIRAPMIARWPAKIRPASATDHISAFWDVLPTLCDIANTKTPDEVDGISFVPAMLGKRQKRHEYLYWEFGERGGKQAVRMGRWKGVRLKTIKNPSGPIELYDLDKDLAEKNDIAAEHPAIVEKMNKAMKAASVAQDR